MQKILTRRNLPSLGIFLFLLLFAVVVNIRMIRYGLNGAIDFKWHLTWLQHFSKQLYEGIWYPRWLAGTNFGYGSPTFVFYPPLVFYLGSILKGLGFNVETVMIILFSIAIFFGGLFCYLYCSNHWKKSASVIAALSFMSAPFLADTIYSVGSISQTFGMSLIPLIFYLTDRARHNSLWSLGLALGWMILALSHLPTLLLTGIIWLIYLLLFTVNFKSKNYKDIAFILLYSFIGLGMASFFLVPMMVEKSLVDIQYMKQIIKFDQLMIGSEAMPFLPIPKLFERGRYIFIVYQYHHVLFVALVGTILLSFRKEFKGWITIFKWLILIIIISFFMTHASWFFWSLSETLQTIQTPLRLQSLLVFFTVCLTCDILHKFALNGKFKLLYYVIWLMIMVIILSNLRLLNLTAKRYPSLHSPGNVNIEHLNFLKEIIDNPYVDNLRDVGEYRPLNFEGHSPGKPEQGQSKVSVLAGKSAINIQKWSSYQRNIHIYVIESSKIRIRTYHYPAWQLRINNKLTPIESLKDSTISIDLTPGNYDIELIYGWTKYFVIGVILSILSIFTLIFVLRYESKSNLIWIYPKHTP